MSEKIWELLWAIFVRILRGLFYFIISSIIILYCYYQATKNEIWIDFYSNNVQGKLLVPRDIVATKDCDKFFKWQWDYIPPPMHSHCPFAEYGPIYKPIVNGMKFEIPREYLVTGSEVDGPANSVSVGFEYPSMKPGNRSRYMRSGVLVFFRDSKREDEIYADNEYKTVSNGYFWNYLTIMPERDKFEIVALGFDESIGMKKYRFDMYSKTNIGYIFHDFVYTNDDIHNPHNFIVCPSDLENSHCQSIFLYKNIYVEYMFEHYLLKKPNKLKDDLIRLIQKWEK